MDNGLFCAMDILFLANQAARAFDAIKDASQPSDWHVDTALNYLRWGHDGHQTKLMAVCPFCMSTRT